MVSIQILETEASLTDAGIIEEPLLWHPIQPRENSILQPSMEQSPYPECSSLLYMNMEFGDEHGEKLTALERITIFSYDETGFYGLSFSYENGEEITYGSKVFMDDKGKTYQCIEQVLPINGKEGEVIAALEVSTIRVPTEPRPIIRAIQVCGLIFDYVNSYLCCIYISRIDSNMYQCRLQQTMVDRPYSGPRSKD
jgi:hypothetical protein